MNLIKKLKINPQVIRYGVVGVFNTVLDFALLFGFKAIGFPIEFANICSTGIAFSASFVLNRKYAFKSTNTNVLREMILFIVVTLFGLWVLQTLVIKFTLPTATDLLHDKNLAVFATKLLATGVSMVWNYLFYSKLVFKSH